VLISSQYLPTGPDDDTIRLGVHTEAVLAGSDVRRDRRLRPKRRRHNATRSARSYLWSGTSRILAHGGHSLMIVFCGLGKNEGQAQDSHSGGAWSHRNTARVDTL
jgi:hypothetical protein